MDQIALKQSVRMCAKHLQQKIEFVQVNDLINSQNNPLFYCTSCINKDLSFKGMNYLLLQQIIDEGQDNILQKWPPVNDYSIMDQLIEFAEQQDSSRSVIHQINQYFTQLKEEFLRKVDLCEKKMINHALQLPLGKESLIEQYQQISKINELRELVLEGEKKDTNNYEQRFRKFISEIESQKEKNSENLSSLLQQCSQKEQLVSFEYPNLIKNSLFTFIDEIDFFNTQIISSNSLNNNSQKDQSSHVKKIMSLISNKSNFCSQAFLSQLEQQLEKMNPLLSKIQFDSMFENNKAPIDFSGLNQAKLDTIKEFVEHSQRIEQNREYSQEIENSYEQKLLGQILESNVNFLNNQFKEQFSKYFKDTYPLLKQINFTNPLSEQEKFDCFRSLSVAEIEDLFQIVKKNKLPAQGNSLNNQIIMRRDEGQPLDIKLIKTSFNGGDTRIKIDQDRSISVVNSIYNNYNSNDIINCVSDIVLDKAQKYILRFQITSERKDEFGVMLGLMQKNKCHNTYGFLDKLCCIIRNKNNELSHEAGYGIDKPLKGDKLKLTNEKEIEMRVWLNGQQLELLDYPDYQYKVGLKDELQNKLISLNDLSLYIGLSHQKINISLKNAIKVNDFPS